MGNAVESQRQKHIWRDIDRQEVKRNKTRTQDSKNLGLNMDIFFPQDQLARDQSHDW